MLLGWGIAWLNVIPLPRCLMSCFPPLALLLCGLIEAAGGALAADGEAPPVGGEGRSSGQGAVAASEGDPPLARGEQVESPVRPPRDGATVFADTGCATCHTPARDLQAVGLGRSLAQVAADYNGEKLVLIDFLNGGPPRENSAQYATMKAQQVLTRQLSADERAALADYLLSFGG